jgi:tetratricopeptide (TPR) repeat protein
MVMNQEFRNKLLLTLLIATAAVTVNGCGIMSPATVKGTASAPPATAIPANVEATESAIRFLEDRVRRDSDDFIAYNKLAAYYLQRQRETGSVNYLTLAAKAAHASLSAMPAEQNVGGLTALSLSEFATHDFLSARDHALKLIDLERKKSYPYEILGDALSELGDYDQATTAYAKMVEIGGRSVSIETRLARADLLRGKPDSAVERLTLALALASTQQPPARETLAWIRWQLGEVAFSMGDYTKAEQHYRDALTTFPDYYRALAGLGRALAAKGDLPNAIANYERAIQVIPDPSFVAALGDLYKLAGRDQEAAAQVALVEQIGKLNVANGMLYNRQIALFYADHDMKSAEAYTQATREYGDRRDIYGADAVAWTALKAGKVTEAQAAIQAALRLGTRDARLLYHAGMVALAANDQQAARDYLKRALALSPQFDPLQVAKAKQALQALGD